MPECRMLLLCLFMAGMAPLYAHTVPTLEVEAEFTPARQVTLHVNVDARLFLAAQPASLPPVPASWWWDQDDAARAKTAADTRAYVARTLTFTVGGQKLEPAWKVIPIESSTIMPLAPTSAEVHLLCEYQGTLPEVAGAFQLSVANNCAVGVILLNSVQGNDQRQPQSLFPGETSRRFVLPDPPGLGSSVAAGSKAGEESPLRTLIDWSSAQVVVGDWLLALILTVSFRGQLGKVLGSLLAFQCGETVAALAVQWGWLATPPNWAPTVSWALLALALGTLWLSPLSRRFPWLLAIFAIAGCGRGWNLATSSVANALWHGSAVLAWQAAFAGLICLGWRVFERAKSAQTAVRETS